MSTIENPQQQQQWAMAAETSDEIAEQIYILAQGDIAIMNQIYNMPTEDQEGIIIGGAFFNSDEDELNWGETTINHKDYD